MKVSIREEALAKELFTHDMGLHQGEYSPWEDQIDYVKNSYRRQAMRVVNTQWFRTQIYEASVMGAYKEAVARSEAHSDNRFP